jgi:signal transduction histidine kinase/ActR/RegA family two-component response regulator
MSPTPTDDRRYERVLVLAPIGRDANLTCEVLRRATLAAHAVGNLEELCREIEAGAGAVVVAQEVMSAQFLGCLHDVLEHQPRWSDLPLVVLTVSHESIDPILAKLAPIANVTLLERPVRMGTLLASVQASLRARRRQLEIRDFGRRKDEFLAMLGHELRNPLGALQTAAHLLAHDDIPLTPKAHRLRNVIERQAHYLARIVDDILDVSRVTTGKIVLERQPVDVNELVRRWLNVFAETEGVRSHTVNIHVPEEPLYVDADAVRLEQVLSNLLANALKYTPAGGHVDISVRQQEQTVVLSVRDTGVGIDPDILPSVFDLFTQDARTLARSQGGLGLGLSLVRTLVQMHGGRVAAYSEGRGRGSLFEVRLPRIAPPALLPARADEPAPTVPPLQIVVVDDNEDGRETVQALLEMAGHRVATAADGRRGLDLILMAQPDVALVDIGLPELDGYEVARRVCQQSNGERPHLIAMTGYGQPEDRHRALEAGFDRHLVKPVRPESLHRLLGQLVREQRRRSTTAARRSADGSS